MTEREVLKLVVLALESYVIAIAIIAAITTIKEVLAQPQLKPLTDEEIDRRLHPTNNEHEHDDRFWDGVEWAKAQIKEKNT